MATVVAAMAATHAPGLTGWFDRAPEADRKLVLDGYGELRRRLEAARPDVLLMLANDHLLNWPINNIPDYTVGIGASTSAPRTGSTSGSRSPSTACQGRPDLARAIVREGARLGVMFAYLNSLELDDGISVPLHYLTPGMQIPLVPITLNCTVPPIPSSERAYRLGEVLREIVTTRWPADVRVAVVATGGLSHEPGGPRYLQVDEAFDRWFLERLAEGDHRRIIRECTVDRMEAAGSGGTASSRVDRDAPLHRRPGRRARLHAVARVAHGNRHGRLAPARLRRPTGTWRPDPPRSRRVGQRAEKPGRLSRQTAAAPATAHWWSCSPGAAAAADRSDEPAPRADRRATGADEHLAGNQPRQRVPESRMLAGRLGHLLRRAPERRGRHGLPAGRLGREEARAVPARAQHEPPRLVHHGDGHGRAQLARAGLSGAKGLLGDLEGHVDHTVLRAPARAGMSRVSGRRAGGRAPSSRGGPWPEPGAGRAPPAGARPRGPRETGPGGRPP